MIIPDTFLTVREELLLFFGAVLLGCGMELLFDIFRAVRLIIPHKAAAAAIEDIVFIVLWAGCIICFTTAFAKGDFRVFYIAGSILGFVLWRLLLGNPFVRLLSRILSAVLRLLKWIISPVSKPCMRMYEKCTRKFVKNAKIQKKNKNIWSALLIAPQKMLYNIFNKEGERGRKKRGTEKKDK